VASRIAGGIRSSGYAATLGSHEFALVLIRAAVKNADPFFGQADREQRFGQGQSQL
jgi:hypothetical protein